MPLGQGQVNLGRMLRRLREIDYRGPLVIERESGSDPIGDILNGRQYLLSLDRSGTAAVSSHTNASRTGHAS